MKRKANESDCNLGNGSVSLIDNIDNLSKTIYIIGEINEETANETITILLETEWEKIKELNIYITSQGGYLADCFAITDLLLYIKEKYSIKINTFGLGEIASAGFFIFIAGSQRKLFPSCRVFVHTHITINSETETYDQRLKADKHEEKEVYDNYVIYTAEQLNLPIVKAKRLLKKQRWLNKKEIKEFNIATFINAKQEKEK
jgi:ATP-dependent protease ClpP protease subunit